MPKTTYYDMSNYQYVTQQPKKNNRPAFSRNEMLKLPGLEPLKSHNIVAVRLITSTLAEFKYGTKKRPWETGGWHVDPQPILLVFYDDGRKYVEGVNTNYLSDWYMSRLRGLIRRFPGITRYDGRLLYASVKASRPKALQMGYRKYLRQYLRNVKIWDILDKRYSAADKL